MSKPAAGAGGAAGASKEKKGENVKVVVRCRPMNSVERERNDSSIVTMDPKLGSIRVQKPDSESDFKTFTFDSVYPPGTEQKFIFDDCTKPIIDSVLNGYNGTLFCYGQTGTGKTFTMEGLVDDEKLRGMVPQAFYYVFAGVELQAKNMEFLVRGSFLEIYKDDVYDLLNAKMRTRMEVKESPEKGVFVKDLSTFTVKSPDDLLKILKVGQKQRKVGATKMNEGSSRSHSILTITIESSEKSKDKEGNESVSYKVGKLNMVDLAGSERQKKCWGAGTLLRMYDGSTKRVEDVVEGDVLIGDDSLPRVVREGSVVQGHTADDALEYRMRYGAGARMEPATYAITSASKARQNWTCNGKHILVLTCTEQAEVVQKGSVLRVQVWQLVQRAQTGITVPEKTLLPQVFALSAQGRADASALQQRWICEHAAPLVWHVTAEEFFALYTPAQQAVCRMFTPEEVRFEPLCDDEPGQPRSLRARLQNAMNDGAAEITDELLSSAAWALGFSLSAAADAQHRSEPAVLAAMQRVAELAQCTDADALLRRLQLSYGLLDSKLASLPTDLLRESPSVRLALLAGLVDGDDLCQPQKHALSFAHESIELVESVASLARSLGMVAGAISSSTRDVALVHELCIGGEKIALLRLERSCKRAALPLNSSFPPLTSSSSPSSSLHSRAYPFTLSKVAHAAYFGFSVCGGPNGRLLLGDYTVTHNTEAQGDRLDEAKSINWSLTVLGNCIKALVEPNSKHVPYRDSKLTRLLQDSLGGNTKTVMCANLGPAGPNFDETISTLRYADRAKQIKNKPVINEDPKDTMLREMQDEISRLKAMLEARKAGGAGAGAGAFLGTMPEGFDQLGQPHSNEGEHVMGIDAIQGDNVVEEIVEKEVIEDTGIKKEDLDEIKRLASEEHAKLVEQYLSANKSEEEARTLAEDATREYERELTRKAEILAKEQAQLDSMAKALADKENQLQKGGAALDAAQRKRDQLKRTEAELALRRAEQEKHMAAMRDAEEQRVMMVEQYSNAGEELRIKSAKLKTLWGLYQQKKNLLLDLVDEFDQERADLLDTIRSLDRQIKLKALVMEEFIPPQAGALIENHAVYDHGQDSWMVPGVEYAGNNVQRSEMNFGGGGGAGSLAFGLMGSSSSSPPKRSFKRDAHMTPAQHHAQQMGGMQVSGMHNVASPSSAKFFNYSQFVQAQTDEPQEKEKKKKKSSKNK